MQYLEPVDLLYHIRLGQNALLGGLDPTQKHLPYWNCDFKNGDLSGFRHSGAWDRCHDVARAIHGLSMAEEITGDSSEEAILNDLAEHLLALFDENDNLPGTHRDDTGQRFVNLHNVREATHALTALIQRGDNHAEYWARRMVRTMLQALDETGQIHLDKLPEYGDGRLRLTVEGYSHQPSQEGRAVDALVRYYRVSGDEVALELATLMTNYALEHCFTTAGTLTEEAGTHGHSINALVAGMLDLVLLLNDQQLLHRVKAVYDVGLPRFNSSFGWSMESLSNFIPRGESNNTGDILRAALLLGRAGFPDYFEHAERILRGHLLPSQVIDFVFDTNMELVSKTNIVEGFSDNPDAQEDRLRNLASRIHGGFAFPTPNDFLVQADAAIVVYDITSGAVDGMCEAWRAIVNEYDAGIFINLLLSCEAKGVRVKSYLSGEGRIDIENASGRNIFVRIPPWVMPKDIRLKVNDIEHTLNFIGSYLLVPGKEEVQTINIDFPMCEERTVESIAYKRYTIDWRGNQIIAMSPEAEHLPMFPSCE